MRPLEGLLMGNTRTSSFMVISTGLLREKQLQVQNKTQEPHLKTWFFSARLYDYIACVSMIPERGSEIMCLNAIALSVVSVNPLGVVLVVFANRCGLDVLSKAIPSSIRKINHSLGLLLTNNKALRRLLCRAVCFSERNDHRGCQAEQPKQHRLSHMLNCSKA